MKDGKVGICLVGAGRAGLVHGRNYAHYIDRAQLVAVVDVNEQTAQAACRELGARQAFTNVEQALERDDIDAVVIVAPTRLHLPIALASAKAGKHIFCEKPMAMTEDECHKMNQAAEMNHVNLQIGFMRRFDASFLEAKQRIECGEIGDVVMVRSNTRGPSVPQPWMYDIQTSNGPLAEVNSHDIDSLRWFTQSEFKTIYAVGGNYRCRSVADAYPDFYDNVIVAATFANGMQGMIDGAQGVGYAYDARVEILGSHGCIFLGRLHDHAIMTCTAESRYGSSPLVSSWRQLFRDAYLQEATEFVDCIFNQTPPRVTGHDGLMAVRVVNAGNRSIREKCVIDCLID